MSPFTSPTEAIPGIVSGRPQSGFDPMPSMRCSGWPCPGHSSREILEADKA